MLSSLTVRDFLFHAGFRDAEALPVKALMRAEQDAKQLHVVGVGFSSATSDQKDRWAGHMAVVVPSLNYLIDTTLFSAKRPQWDFLPGMLAVPIAQDDEEKRHFDLKAITGFRVSVPDKDYEFRIVWLDDRQNTLWKRTPDTSKRRRERVVSRMLDVLANRS